jgi:hypothetical protein
MKIKVLVPLRDEAGNPVVQEEEIQITLLKYIQARLGFGFFWKSGKLSPLWKGFLGLWIIHCPRHGFVVTYRQGYDGTLNCPFCLMESDVLSHRT